MLSVSVVGRTVAGPMSAFSVDSTQVFPPNINPSWVVIAFDAFRPGMTFAVD